jgi:hypothetical protein
VTLSCQVFHTEGDADGAGAPPPSGSTLSSYGACPFKILNLIASSAGAPRARWSLHASNEFGALGAAWAVIRANLAAVPQAR